MDDMKNCCVFEPKTYCPTRKAINDKYKTINKLNRLIKPLGDKEILQMYVPILEKIQEAFNNEFQTFIPLLLNL